MSMLYKTPALSTVTAMAFIVSATAQQSGIERAPVQTGYQTVSVTAENESLTCAARHTHPGIESTYVLDREIILKVDGKPDQVIKAGSSLRLPAAIAHDVAAAIYPSGVESASERHLPPR